MASSKTAKENAEYIKVKILSKGSNKKNFRIKRSTRLGKLKKSYSETLNVAAPSVSFVFRGNVINDDSTPQSLKMKENDVIEAQEVTEASFDDLLGDLEKIKAEMKGSNAQPGSSSAIQFDENTAFQYLEEAKEDPNRIRVVCNRLKAGQKGENSKKRKREASTTREDCEQETFNYLREMFPDLPELYLKEKVKMCKNGNIEKVVESLLTGDIPSLTNAKDASYSEGGSALGNNAKYRSPDALDDNDLGGKLADNSMTDDEQASALEEANEDYVQHNLQTLINIFPDVDPEFLREQSLNIGVDPAKLEAFITASLEKKSSFPSRKEYEKRKNNRDQMQKIKMLTVNDFLELWEDPHAHFADSSSTVSQLYKEHAVFRLRKKFPQIHHTEVVKALEEHNHHFFPALKKIQNLSPKKGKRRQAPLPQKPSQMEMNFLKEYIYSKLESQIRRHQEKLETEHNEAVEKARSTGGLFECGCCFDGDCLLSEAATCEEGHMFCKDCLRRGAGVQIGDQKTQISCLIACGSTFPLTVLQSKLSSLVFSRLLQKRQHEEIQAAGLDDLVQCPACNFAAIMPDPTDKVVRCGNPECGKESCRLCQEDNHIPLTCDEVEKDSDVADRVRLENAMTEAMLRSCVACQKKFFKEDGCNKMKCECGATMCYLCRKPVPDNYSHFYGQGADPKDGTCPLWSDNKNLHKEEVFQAAKRAKKDLNKNVKYDPTKNLEKPPEGFNPNELHAHQGVPGGVGAPWWEPPGGQDVQARHQLIMNRVMQLQMHVMQMRGARRRVPHLDMQFHGMLNPLGPTRRRAAQPNRQLRRPPQAAPEIRPDPLHVPPQEVILVEDD